MKYKLQNNDCLKLLEIPKKDGTFVKSIAVTFAYLNKEKINSKVMHNCKRLRVVLQKVLQPA